VRVGQLGGAEAGPLDLRSDDVLITRAARRVTVANARATVLMVEDDADNRTIYRIILEHFGFRVIVAADGEAGIPESSRRAPGRGADGHLHSADRRPRGDPHPEGRPGHGRDPIIALTAHALDEDRARVAEAGCDAYISRPAVPGHVASVVERLLAERGRTGAR
jgi:two-component system, cell cycle response regulator DivK